MSRSDFYSTAAQVIPVIWLALMFEKRVLEGKRLKPSDPAWPIFSEALGVYSLLLAEIAALTVLASGRDTDAALVIVIVGMGSGVTPLVHDVVRPIAAFTGLWFGIRAPSRLRRHGEVVSRITLWGCVLVVPFVMIVLLH